MGVFDRCIDEKWGAKERILKEDQATYTYENAIFSRNQLTEKEIAIKKAIICCHAFHARRCQMYYEQIFPTVKLMIHPVDTELQNRIGWTVMKELKKFLEKWSAVEFRCG